jgi:hypothetical protein
MSCRGLPATHYINGELCIDATGYPISVAQVGPTRPGCVLRARRADSGVFGRLVQDASDLMTESLEQVATK